MTESEQRYFEVLMEEMNGKFSLVLEGHDAIRKEFNGQLDDIREQQRLFISLLKSSHDELKEEIRGVDKRSEARDKALEVRLTAEIRGVDKRSEARDAALTAEIRAAGDKVDGHEERIAPLEKKAA